MTCVTLLKNLYEGIIVSGQRSETALHKQMGIHPQRKEGRQCSTESCQQLVLGRLQITVQKNQPTPALSPAPPSWLQTASMRAHLSGDLLFTPLAPVNQACPRSAAQAYLTVNSLTHRLGLLKTLSETVLHLWS